MISYDEHLFTRAQNQWQFGDWKSLAELSRDAMQSHPKRARIALLAAAGRLQIGAITEARDYIQLAREWGVEQKLVLQLLISGIHNSLGRAAAAAGNATLALKHFESAVDLDAPESDTSLVCRARVDYQCSELGVPSLPIGGRSDLTPSTRASSAFGS